MIIKPGSIISFNAKEGGWFSTAQRIVTGMPYTHSAIAMPNYLGEMCYFGADMTVNLKPVSRFLNDKTIDFEIWEWVGISDTEINDILHQVFIEFAGKPYGYLQILWFVYRRFMEEVFKKDVRRQHNWFPDHEICSEVTYMACRYFVQSRWNICTEILDEWRRDTFHSGDQAAVVRRFTGLGYMKLAFARWNP